MPVDAIRPATVREAMTAEYGKDWTKGDYRSGISHVATFFEGSYRTDYKDLLIVAHTSANDMFGYDDAVTVSNYRVLQDRWSELQGLSRGPWSNVDVIALEVDQPAPADLTEVLDGLSDYPIVDEQEWSNVEQEMVQEHWESYGKYDALNAVAKAIAIGADELTDAAGDIVNRLTFEGILDYGCSGGYPTFEDSSSVDFGTEEVAKFIAENVGTLVKFDRYGTAVELDLTRTNLVAE
jgi:hypothetical protein